MTSYAPVATKENYVSDDDELSDEAHYLPKSGPRRVKKGMDKMWCCLTIFLILFAVACIAYAQSVSNIDTDDDIEIPEYLLNPSNFNNNKNNNNNQNIELLSDNVHSNNNIPSDPTLIVDLSRSSHYSTAKPTKKPTGLDGKPQNGDNNNNNDNNPISDTNAEKPTEPPHPTEWPTLHPAKADTAEKPTEPPHPTEWPTVHPIRATVEENDGETAVDNNNNNATPQVVPTEKPESPKPTKTPTEDNRDASEQLKDFGRIEDLGSPRSSINFDLDEAIKVVDNKLKEICDMWPNNVDCIMMTIILQPLPIPNLTDGLMTPMQRKFMRAILEEKPEDRHFVASFSGSSNSAGHGSWGRHAYSLAIMHFAQETFAKAGGLNFTSRNQALGSMGAYPHTGMCHQSVFGLDADFVTYEFGMFREGECIQEIWARYAFNMPRQPVAAIVNAGGPAHCANWYGKGWGRFKNQGRLDEYQAHLGKTGMDLGVYHEPEYFLTDQYLIDSGLDPEETIKWFETEMPFTPEEEEKLMKEQNNADCYGKKKCTLNGKGAERYGDLGLYNYNFVLGSRQDHTGWWQARGLACRVAHHPGDLAHTLAGSQMAYHFLEHYKQVLELIMAHNTPDGLRKLYEEATTKFPLPAPVKEQCRGGGEEHTPICYSSFDPHNGVSLWELIDEYNGWIRKEGFSPYENERKKYEHLDVHTVVQGTSENGWLELKPVTVTDTITKNHKKEDGKAWLTICNGLQRFCENDKKGPADQRKKCSTAAEIWDILEVKINGENQPWSDLEKWDAATAKVDTDTVSAFLPFKTDPAHDYDRKTDKMFMRSGYCLALKYVPPGDYRISLRVKSTEHKFWLTHVMVL